ncbi:MAG: HAD family hydrolase [Acidobacteria bacterium]|nr:HAD family hydrolase [Acidobacteriota bacterium]
MTRAVLFDVDFTLIYPGPTFQGTGYEAFCARFGINVDATRFDAAVSSAARLLDLPDDTAYDDEIHVRYTRHIIEQMGGRGDAVDAAAREIYREWAACHHFELFDEVPTVLRALASEGMRLGLVSNSHRCLVSFQAHFDLTGLIAATVSSSEHGMMKPHPSIFTAALGLLDVAPPEALMVGDSLRHDVEGALQVGMRAALLHRSDTPHPRAQELAERGVPVLRSLKELLALIRERS